MKAWKLWGLCASLAIGMAYGNIYSSSAEPEICEVGDEASYDSGELGTLVQAAGVPPVSMMACVSDAPCTMPLIAAGYNHTVALKSDGTVWAWGNNSYGQLGNGTTNNSSQPVQVMTSTNTALSNVVAVAGGNLHTVALRADGTVWAWGDNSYGQLGNGTTSNSSQPVQVMTSTNTALSNVVAVAAGSYHTVALRADGTVWAWGYNSQGQLGDGATNNSSQPVQVMTSTNAALSNVVAVAAGSSHTVALRADGTVWAWGNNSSGQFGNGTSALSGVVAVAAGGWHTVALRADGTVWAWGSNDYGQLGDGTATNRNRPVQSSFSWETDTDVCTTTPTCSSGACVPGICNGHGSCNTAGSCACNSGFVGPSCQYSNATTCNGHGTAQNNGSCSCYTGFGGSSCNQCATNYYGYPSCATFCQASTTCNGHGSCNAAGSCSCNTDFTGANCNQCATNYYGPSCTTFCQASTTCNGHGSCNSAGSCSCNTGFTGASCSQCATGFTGANCNQCATNYYGYPSCTTFCQASTTCGGHGSCNTAGSCACNSGFAGSNCQYSDALNCSSHGTVGVHGNCSCNTGFTGTQCNQCTTDYYGYPTCTYCEASTTCNGHGSCNSDGSCTCDSGFVGPNCQYSNATTCNGHGTAQSDGSCTCDSGFFGAGCYSDTTTCNGYGKAQIDGSCVCNPGVAGSNCQYIDTMTCNSHGTAQTDGSCVCSPGFAGPGCQYGDTLNCSSHGTAQVDGSCACNEGFDGASCNQCARGFSAYPNCARQTNSETEKTEVGADSKGGSGCASGGNAPSAWLGLTLSLALLARLRRQRVVR